jgi:ABC-type dipeptide/oligopeptide/nickel transport system ATPase component
MERELILELHTGTIAARLARAEKTLVQNVTLSLAKGESHALIGETGSGKTMTALSILRLLPRNVYQSGERILYGGAPLPKGRRLRRLIGTEIVYIPQSGAESLNPSMTVRRQLWDGMRKNRVPLAKRNEKARALLRAVGFDEPEVILSKYTFELSGGMAQRVTIALAAIGTPKLLLADEPTNGLDQAATDAFFALLDRLFPRAAKLIITHDIAVARHCADVTVLCRGRMCERGPADSVLDYPWHPYTKALTGALVQNGMLETPVLRSGNSPCPFYARCPKAGDFCENEPVRIAVGDRECWCSRL